MREVIRVENVTKKFGNVSALDCINIDEPMNGLDNQGLDDVRNILLNLKKEGKTIILASHNKKILKSCVMRSMKWIMGS